MKPYLEGMGSRSLGGLDSTLPSTATMLILTWQAYIAAVIGQFILW